MAKCDTCKANKVCDHNRFGFENCGNYISTGVVEAIQQLREKCIEQQEFLIGEDGKFKGYVSFEDMDNIISDMGVVAENAITAE